MASERYDDDGHEGERLSEGDFADQLAGLLCESDADGLPVESVSSFEAAGVLTRDAGLVVRLTGGGEYQVTVVMSRRRPAILARKPPSST